jgi:hypothetical protein
MQENYWFIVHNDAKPSAESIENHQFEVNQ